MQNNGELHADLSGTSKNFYIDFISLRGIVFLLGMWLAVDVGFPTSFLYIYIYKKLNFMERFQYHGSIQKANEKQEMTSHRLPAWLEHTNAIIRMFATGPNRVTNNSSSSPFCV